MTFRNNKCLARSSLIVLKAVIICYLIYFQLGYFGVVDQYPHSTYRDADLTLRPLYEHRIPRILHHIWLKNVTNKVVSYAEPVEILSTCLLANCVDYPGGWVHRHWDEDNIKELKAWPLLQRFWTKPGVYGDAHKMSDIIRLAVLSEHGGAYMDSLLQYPATSSQSKRGR